MRGIEIEVPDQSDVVPSEILNQQKGKQKFNVDGITKSLLSLSSKYSPIFVLYRKPVSMIPSKEQTPYRLFSLFISSNLLQIIANHTNLKADREHVQVTKNQRQWYPTNQSEIGAFLGILLYMGYTAISRIRDFWNVNPKLAIYSIFLKSMSLTR